MAHTATTAKKGASLVSKRNKDPEWQPGTTAQLAGIAIPFYDIIVPGKNSEKNYRVRVIASVPPDPKDKGFGGAANQATADFFEWDPRSLETDNVFTTRVPTVTGNWLGKDKYPVPVAFHITVSLTTDPPTEGIARRSFPKGTGPYPLTMEKEAAQVYKERGHVLEMCQKGVAALGSPRVLHTFMFYRYDPSGGKYNLSMMMQDMAHVMANGISQGLITPGQEFATWVPVANMTTGIELKAGEPLMATAFTVHSNLPKPATMQEVRERMPLGLDGKPLWDAQLKMPEIAVSKPYQSIFYPPGDPDAPDNSLITKTARLEVGVCHEYEGVAPKGNRPRSTHMFLKMPVYHGEPFLKLGTPLNKNVPSLPFEYQELNRLIVGARAISADPYMDLKGVNPITVPGIWYPHTGFVNTVLRGYNFQGSAARENIDAAHYQKQRLRLKKSNVPILDERALVINQHNYRARLTSVNTQEFTEAVNLEWPNGVVGICTNLAIPHRLFSESFAASTDYFYNFIQEIAATTGDPRNRFVEWGPSTLYFTADETGSFRNYPDQGTMLTRIWFRSFGYDEKIREHIGSIPKTLQMNARPGVEYMTMRREGKLWQPMNTDSRYKHASDSYLATTEFANRGLFDEHYGIVAHRFVDEEDAAGPGVILLLQNLMDAGNAVSLAWDEGKKLVRIESTYVWDSYSRYGPLSLNAPIVLTSNTETTFYYSDFLIFEAPKSAQNKPKELTVVDGGAIQTLRAPAGRETADALRMIAEDGMTLDQARSVLNIPPGLIVTQHVLFHEIAENRKYGGAERAYRDKAVDLLLQDLDSRTP